MIDFWFDVACPYAAAASLTVEEMGRRHGREVRWRPVSVGVLMRHFGASSDSPAREDTPKGRLLRADVVRQAARAGLALRWPARPVRSLEALRLLHATPHARRPDVARAMARAVWERGDDLEAPEVLARFARMAGVAYDAGHSVSARASLRATTAEAIARDLFGVPTFTSGKEQVWGDDRRHFFEEALCGHAVVPGAPPWDGTARTVTFFHDVASPFSYLASTVIEELAARQGATIEWVPILLGGLFRALGTVGIPLHALHEVKQAWVHSDLANWARWRGVSLRWPSRFPVWTVTAQRALIVEPRAVHAVYAAAWVADRDLSSPGVLAEVLSSAGFEGKAIVQATADPAIKSQLRAHTERALSSGVIGVPTFVVGDTLLWGQDRMVTLEHLLAGSGAVSHRQGREEM